MTVLALESLDADGLFDALCKTRMPLDVEVLEIDNGLLKVNIDGVQCNTVALHLVYGIAEKEDIEKIIKERNLKFAWL